MAHSLQDALYAVLYHQDVFQKDAFDWAFVLLGVVTSEVVEGLEELTDCAFDSFRNGGEAAYEISTNRRHIKLQ